MERKTKNLISKISGAIIVPTFILAACLGPSEGSLTKDAKEMVKDELGGNVEFTSVQYKEKEEFSKEMEVNPTVEFIVSGFVDDYFFWVYYNEDGDHVARAILDTDDFDYDDDGIKDYLEDYTIVID